MFQRWMTGLIALLIVALALAVLYYDLHGVRMADIRRALDAMPVLRLLACLGLTAASFVALGGYDVLAARVVAPKLLPARLAWLAGAVSNGISNTLGFHAVTAVAVRYRLYRRAGLDLAQVAQITSLSWTSLAFGFASVFSLALIFGAQQSATERALGLALAVFLPALAYWLGAGRTIRIARWSFPLPSTAIAISQMGLGAVEMSAAIGALYVLMPSGLGTSFPAFCAVYIGAVLLGIASHAPGGIGVFEAAMLSLSNPQDRASLLAALLLYRLIYNILPFALAVLALAGFTAMQGRTGQLERG